MSKKCKSAACTYPRTTRGTKQSPADRRKTKPGYHATVTAYTLLKTAFAILLVKLSMKERQANRAPANTHTHTKEKREKQYFYTSDEA